MLNSLTQLASNTKVLFHHYKKLKSNKPVDDKVSVAVIKVFAALYIIFGTSFVLSSIPLMISGKLVGLGLLVVGGGCVLIGKHICALGDKLHKLNFQPDTEELRNQKWFIKGEAQGVILGPVAGAVVGAAVGILLGIFFRCLPSLPKNNE